MAKAVEHDRFGIPGLTILTPQLVRGRVRVLVLDSGVGGLHVCRHIARRLPDAGLLFCADSAAFPYGMRDENFVVERVVRLAEMLVARVRPDVIVTACNTASTVALGALRQRLDVPVVGVVPAIKPAAERSLTRIIGLLGTPATVSRAYTDDLIARFAGDCHVVRVGSAGLVTLAEQKLRGRAVSQEGVAAGVAPLFRPRTEAGDAKVDTVVLACTHFPWLRAEFRRAAPWRVSWIDSAAAIARRVASLTGPSTTRADVRHCAVFTGHPFDSEGSRYLRAAAGFRELIFLGACRS